MPQFDAASFASQIFWLGLLFGLLWLILARTGLPRVERIFEDREQRIDNDLQMAEKFSADADKVQETYEQALAQARAHSQSAMAEAHAKMTQKLADADARLDEALAKRLDEAQARITQAQTQAMGEMGAVAADAAADLVARLNIPVDAAKLRQAVDASLQSEGQG